MRIAKPFLLAILDGWGMSESRKGNAIALAHTPVMDSLYRTCPHTTLSASGEAVGLPPGQMGDSEVGHLNIGTGRLVLQDLQRINTAIKSGEFYHNRELLSAIEHASKEGVTLHLIGLLSDGGVHSHIDHLFALLDMAERAGLTSVCTHALLDGRDVPPRSALGYVKMLGALAGDINIGSIRTIAGRYYGMDRDNRWDRTGLAYDAIVRAIGPPVQSAGEAVLQSYGDGVDDEFLVPTIVGEPETMKERDSVIFLNFRPDRARQLACALIQKEFSEFDRGDDPVLPYMVTMTEYDDRFGVPCAFPPEKITNTLADVLAAHGKTQLHIAETEKYAHVTYFFNGGVEEPKPGEDRVMIPSPHVRTYDIKPEMSAGDVAAETAHMIRTGGYDFIVLNFANCDMVGHTGFMDAVVKAVEAVDRNLGIVLEALNEKGGAAFVTADHGNAEMMTEDGATCTAHSSGAVPFINFTSDKRDLRSCGSLGDVAPTVLEVMGIPQPQEMTGTSLLAPVEKNRG